MELMVDGDSIILSHVQSGTKSSRAVDSPMPDHSFQRLQKLSFLFPWSLVASLHLAGRMPLPCKTLTEVIARMFFSGAAFQSVLCQFPVSRDLCILKHFASNLST
jgi:hypothetical protein